MAKQVGAKFAWVIKDFSSLQCEKYYSAPVLIDDCKWRLRAYPKGVDRNLNCFSVFLEVDDFKSLPSGWRRYVKLRLTIVRQISEEPSVMKEAHRWFDQEESHWGFKTMIPLTKLYDEKENFLVNGELMITAEVDVHQVIGTLKESEETNPLKKLKQDESVSSTQDIALDFRAKTQHLKIACMNVLLSLTQMLFQTHQEISLDDLNEAEKTLAYMKDSGFEVDWLKKKLEEAKENKKKEQSG